MFDKQNWHFKDLNQYSVSHKIRFKQSTNSKQVYRKLKYREKVSEEFQRVNNIFRGWSSSSKEMVERVRNGRKVNIDNKMKK